MVNPASGRRNALRAVPAVIAALGRHFAVTELGGADAAEATDLARSAVEDGYDALVVMGGDGTVHLALQSVAGSATVLGVVATGNGNDVARYLGLPRKDPLAAARVIVAGHTRVIDCARVGSTSVATVVACGFDSRVNERANRLTWPPGQLRYTRATLAELRVGRPVSFVLELDGIRMLREAMLVAVGNGPSYGGGLRMCEGAEIDDGLLDVVIISPLTRIELARLYPRLFRGTHVHHSCYEHHLVRHVSIAAPDLVAYGDGERIGPLPLTVEAVPAAVTVFAPAP